MQARIAVALSCLIGCTTVGEEAEVTSSTAGPTWEEFLATTHHEGGEEDIYVVDGDVPVYGVKNLREFYDSFQQGGLIVNTSGGADTKWNDTQKLNLTYCISNNFGTNKAAVVEAFRQATDLGWETRGNVNFVYLSSQDSNCTASNTNVVFDVRPVNVNGQYLARAFFPNTARSGRNVLIDNTAFDPTLPWPLKNIVGHELGHALGFRHEHTRPESGTCFEDNNWRPLTPYDAASIMHYPQCNGTSNDLAFSSLDAQGVAALYGAPGGTNPPPPTTTTTTWSGSLTRGVFRNLGSVTAKGGTTLTVQMTGSGDSDLYVRFGAAPTRSSFNCRPYGATSNETCTLTVPAGTSTVAYIAVDGYSTSSTYNVTATYVKP